ncbi:excalibur calcium-binding domain-containing protein [Streptomyces sp. NPDC088124]|uniref:excalibur calcium-binding domain-containing protein n=1 Tax=Streptomyces sp. NPDC088124 TaxID=3154654 RepID=UPI00342F5614
MPNNPPPQPTPWGQSPQTGTNPYTAPGSPNRPKWTRKRVLLPAAGLLFLAGVGIGTGEDPAQSEKASSVRAAPETPAATVTATTTETTAPAPAVTETVTAKPKPAPTVTETKTVEVTVEPAVDPDPDAGGNDESVYYRNCAAARAAGAAPVHAGDPGYGPRAQRFLLGKTVVLRDSTRIGAAQRLCRGR